MLYAPSHIQQDTILIADIPNIDIKIPTLTPFNAKSNVEWQEPHTINLYQPFQQKGEH